MKKPKGDGARGLAAAIVIQAISDWRQLVRAKAWLDGGELKHKNFYELRAFFKSDWCAFLLEPTGITPRVILQALEKELQEAKEKDEPSSLSPWTLRY